MSRNDGIKITEVKESQFGLFYTLYALRHEDGTFPSGIIVAYNNGGGFVPVQLLLPNQLYVDRVNEIKKEFSAKEIWVYPIYDTSAWTEVEAFAPLWYEVQKGDMWTLTYNGEDRSAIVVASGPGEEEFHFFVEGVDAVDLKDPKITNGRLVFRRSK